MPDDELYVMLMLQRSEEGTAAKVDCDDAAIALACELDSDKCPAECKKGSKEDSEKENLTKSINNKTLIKLWNCKKLKWNNWNED